jgi:iron complex transport system ATP-binding protein
VSPGGVTTETKAHAPESGTSAGGSLGEIRLNVEQASYAYAARQEQPPRFTLEALSLQGRQREMVAVVGPNASGKSTLLRLLSGALQPLSGRVQLDGFEVCRLDSRTRAQRIAIVQQESALLFPMRVWEYVLQGRHPYGRALRFETPEDLAIIEDALAQVGASHLGERKMGELSGGEKQRVILARAMAQRPLLLLLDEPTLHLDIGSQVELLRHLARLAAQNRYTVVLVTHELNLAAEFADRVVILYRGKCLRFGSPAEVYRRELLEQVFGTELEVETSASGMPRVVVKGQKQASVPA